MPVSGPLIRQISSSVQDTSTSPKGTAEALTWKSDDVIVIAAQDEGSATASRFGTPTATGLTFAIADDGTTNGNGQSSNRAASAIYIATAGSDGSATPSMTNSAGIIWRYHAIVVQDTDGLGVVWKDITTTNAGPSNAKTTIGANSTIIAIQSDGTAADGASRAFRTPTGTTAAVEPTATSYYRNAAQYTAYLWYHADTGSIGSKTIGISTPSTQSVNMVAIELKGKSTTITGSGDNLLNPIVDVHNQGWTNNAAGTTNLYQAIDENTASDSDYIQAGTTGLIYEAALESITDPASSTGHILHTRYKKDTAADTVSLKAELMQGSTVLVTRNYSNIGTSFTTDDYTLSSGETDSITDYANLRVRFTPTVAPAAPSKVQEFATTPNTAAITTVDFVLTGLTVGNILIIRTAADNSGTNGAARTITVTNQSGTAIDTGTDVAFQQNTDPGAASAGVTCNVVVATITATSGTVRVTYSGSVVQASVAEEWSGITGAVVGTPVGASGTASTNLASVADASVASGNLVYGVEAVEGPSTDTYTQDADTTNGSWSSLTKQGTNSGTATNDMTVYGGYKVVTATGAQTYNPTIGAARDSAGLILELTAVSTTSAKAVVSWTQLETPASGTTVTGSQVSETDTGQAGVSRITTAGAQSSETDTGQVGVPRVTPAGAQASETDTAQAGVPRVTKAGTQATETDTGQAGVSRITTAGAQAAETDTAQTGALRITAPGTQATETDTAQAGAPVITVAGSQVTETDEAQAGSAVVGVTITGTQVTETDTAQAGAPIIIVAGSQATETDTAQAGEAIVGVDIAGTQVTETDTAQGGALRYTYAGSQATETDSGAPGGALVTVAGSQVPETDTGASGAVLATVAGSHTTETDTVQAGAPRITVAGSQATETDEAEAGETIVGVNVEGAQVTETDTAQHGVPRITVAGSQVTETDTAQAGAPLIVITVAGAQAAETDTAQAGAPVITVAGSQVTETDEAQAGVRSYVWPGAQAAETDTANAGSPHLVLQGGQAVETDTPGAGRPILPAAPFILLPTQVSLEDDGALHAPLSGGSQLYAVILDQE